MRRKKGPEEIIQENVFQHVRQRAAAGAIIWHTFQSGKLSIQEARRRKALGVSAGIPDVLALKGGKFYALELKAPGNYPTPEQILMMQMMQAQGAEVFCATGFDQAITKMEQWGLLTGKASNVKIRPQRKTKPHAVTSIYADDIWMAG